MRPWSYSRLTTYEDCPKQFWYSYVDKMEGFRPPSPAADRGTRIHKAGEDYLAGTLKVYPPEYQKVAMHMMNLKSVNALPEVKVAVNDKWEIVDYKDPDAYLRGQIDVHYESPDKETVYVEDFKTGQVYASHPDQMKTYVALAASMFPTAKYFVTRLVYIDQGMVTTPINTPVERVRPIKLMLDGRIKNAEEDTIFSVKPGSACKWCDYSKKYGGPCPH